MNLPSPIRGERNYPPAGWASRKHASCWLEEPEAAFLPPSFLCSSLNALLPSTHALWRVSQESSGLVTCFLVSAQAAMTLACVLSRFSYVWLFVTPWTIAHQAPLSLGFSRQEYWSGLPGPPPEDFPTQGSNPHYITSPALQADSLSLAPPGKPAETLAWVHKTWWMWGIISRWKH